MFQQSIQQDALSQSATIGICNDYDDDIDDDGADDDDKEEDSNGDGDDFAGKEIYKNVALFSWLSTSLLKPSRNLVVIVSYF